MRENKTTKRSDNRVEDVEERGKELRFVLQPRLHIENFCFRISLQQKSKDRKRMGGGQEAACRQV